MKEGNIILTPIPQANGEIKNRPTLILREMPKYQDFLICGISTQLKQYIPNFDVYYFCVCNYRFGDAWVGLRQRVCYF